MRFKNIHLQWFASTNNIKVTVGLEATAGTAAPRTYVVPISGVAGLDKTANTLPDPAIVGSNMASSEVLVFTDVAGDIPLAIRPVGGYAQIVKSLLGQEILVGSNPEQVHGGLRIRYTGVQPSARIIFDATTKDIRSLIGVRGSEVGDSNFITAGGPNGTVSLTAATADTLGEVVSLINGFADYDCEKLFGLDALDPSAISDATAGVQGQNRWAVGWALGDATSGVYKHVFTADLSNAEKPTLSIAKDGYEDNFLYAGVVADAHQITGTLKALVEGSVSLLGFTEASGQTESALTLEDVDPLVFYKGDFSIEENEYDFIRNFELNFSNNHNPDGYGAGGVVGRQYHQKGLFSVEGSVQVRLDSTSLGLRNNIFADSAPIGAQFVLEGNQISTGDDVPEMLLVDLPYADLMTFEFAENAGVFDANIGFRAVNPKGSPLGVPVTFTMLTVDASAY